MCVLAAFVPHRPNKYFHVTASNGIVSNSPYTPLAIMTASPIASVRVFDPRCRCRLATFAALPTPSTIYREIIMLNNHRFWGHASGPSSSSGKTRSSFHPLLARPCRSALPRERFSPLRLKQTCAGHPGISPFDRRPCRRHSGSCQRIHQVDDVAGIALFHGRSYRLALALLGSAARRVRFRSGLQVFPL